MATVSKGKTGSKSGPATSNLPGTKPIKEISPNVAAVKAIPVNPYSTAPQASPLGASSTVANPYTTAPPAHAPVNTAASPISNVGGSQSVVNPLNTVGAASVNSPGSAGSMGDNHGFNQGTTDPLNGAIGGYGYTPLGAGTLYDNPQALATDILKSMGINNPGLANSLSQTLDPAVAAQFLLNNGKNSSDADTLNFANQYMQNMVTPGGATVNFSSLMDHLLGAGGQYADGHADNALAAYLNAGLDPSQQVRAAQGLMGQSMTGQNPYFQQGFSNYAKDLGSSYQGLMAKGDPQYKSFIDYLNRSSGIGNWG
jgi:hypothetical protein